MPETGLSVLVVEDVDMLQAMVERVLSLHGHRALVCRTGEQALELLRDPGVVIDVVLTDVVLDGIDGIAVAKASWEHRPATPVVLMSGEDEAEVRRRLPPGAVPRFVRKPYANRELVASVEAAWRDAGVAS